MRSWFSRLRNVFRGDAVSQEIEREMAFHLSQRTDDLVAAGMSQGEARNEARRRFGNPGVQIERTRDRDVIAWFETTLSDVRYAVRGLRRTPGFTIVAILSLALGIGANTAIFTAVNAVMLRPLPVRSPGQLVYVASGREETFSYPMYEGFRDRVSTFGGLAAIERGSARHEFSLTGGDASEPAILRAPAVTGTFFATLGVPALIGRFLGPADDSAGAPPALVLSHALWQRQFAGDSSVLGRLVRLDRLVATIVGVMPKSFIGFDATLPADAWWPIRLLPQLSPSDRNAASRLTSNGITWLIVFGRLRDGVSREHASAEVATVFRQGLEQIANDPAWTASDRERILSQSAELRAGGAGYVRVRSKLRKPLVVVMAVVGMVLLIACANVAGLMLARAAARQQEFALRAALGGGRGRIIRQLLTESLLLSFIGGAAGFVIARWAAGLLGGYLPQDEIALALEPDSRVLLFTGAVSLVAGVVFGLAPALQLSRTDIISAIKLTGGQSAARSRMRLHSVLVVGQLAVSVLLLTVAGLFGRTLSNLESIDLGFQRENTVTFGLDIGRRRLSARELRDLEYRVVQSVSALPGVASATIAGAGLLSDNGYSVDFGVDGHDAAPGEEMRAYAVLAGPRFFETLGVPLLRGRGFGDADEPAFATDGSPGRATVVVLGEAFARRYFGALDPIGRQITRGKNGERLTIVGVAGDTKYRQDPRASTPLEIYLPYFGAGIRMQPMVFVRTKGRQAAIGAGIRDAVVGVDTRTTVRQLATMDEMVGRALVQERLIAQLVALFGAFAVLLATVGLYGIVSYSVARRTREFGVRIAMGATAGDVLRLVVRQGVMLALVGCAIGVTGALAASRLMKNLLYGVGPGDPLTHVMVVALLVAVATLACWFPARRAARVAPMMTLREE